MRKACIALAILALAACHRGLESKDAVRQAVIDYLAAKKFNLKDMAVDVT